MAKKIMDEPPYQCPKERELGEITTKVDALQKVMHDNGHDGLITTVQKLSFSLTELNKKMTDNNTITSAVYKFMQDYETEKRVRENVQKIEIENLNRRYKLLGSVLGVFGALTTVAIIFFGNGVIKAQASTKENEKQIYMQKIDSNTVIYFMGAYQSVDSFYWSDADNQLIQPEE